MIDGVRKTLYILEAARRHSIITVAQLSQQDGWNKASASRYLQDMSDAGWLEKVSSYGRPRYVLGRKAMEFGVDLKF